MGLTLVTKTCERCPSMMDFVHPNRRFCEPCRLAKKRADHHQARQRWLDKNPGKRSGYNRRAALKRKYGMTEADYEAMLQKQGGLCALCRKESATRVDHCHDTGAVRGLLCHGCNVRLSGVEDRSWRAKALEYLGEV